MVTNSVSGSRRRGRASASVSQPQMVNPVLKRFFIRGSRGAAYQDDFKAAYQLDSYRLVRLVKTGIPAQALANVASRMRITNERLFITLGLMRATAARKIREKAILNAVESSRLLGLARLIGQVQMIVEESGNPKDFDAARWVAQWLYAPSPALGTQPAELMDTNEGQAIVANLVARMQSGTYS